MDDPPDSAPDPSDDDRPASRRRRSTGSGGSERGGSGSGASAGRSTKGSTTRTRPRRWYEQPWLWLAVVVVVVAGAIGVSVLVGSDPDDITPSQDTTAFCNEARNYKQVRDANSLKPSTDDADQAAQRAALVRVQQASPPEIRPTTDQVLAALDQVARIDAQTDTSDTSLDAAAASARQLGEVEDSIKHPSIRFSNYLRRACGLDLDVTPSPPPALVTTTAVPAVAPASPSSPGGGGTFVPPTSLSSGAATLVPPTSS